MADKDNFDYNLGASFTVETSSYTGTYVPDETFSQSYTPFQFNPQGSRSDFDSQSITDELKISAEAADFKTSALGQVSGGLFSSLSSGSGKIQPIDNYINNKDVYENLYDGSSVSRYKNVRNLLTDENRLANEQTTGERLGNGLTKAVQNFSKVFVQNTGGAIYGIGSAVANGQWDKLYDNEFTDALDDWNTRSRYNLPNYKSDQEKQMSFFSKMGTANFWADDVAQGLSFTLGTIASEIAWTYMTGGAGIFALGATRAGTAFQRGRNAVAQYENIVNYFPKMKNFLALKTLSNIKDGSNIIRSIYTSSAMEAGMEAKQTFRDSYDSFIQSSLNNTGKVPTNDQLLEFDNQARKAANMVFVANIPVVALSNFAQFSTLFGLNLNLTKNLTKAIGYDKFIGVQARAGISQLGKITGENAFKVSKLGKVVGFIAPKASVALTEGVWEEGTQGILSTTAKEWLASRYNVDKTSENLSLMEAMYDAMAHQYGTKEGREEMYIGMLIGAFGGNISQAIQNKSVAPLVTGFFRSENSKIREANIQTWDLLGANINNRDSNANLAVEENFNKVYNNTLNTLLLKNQQDHNMDLSQEALDKGDVIGADIHKMNAEFATHFMNFERFQDSVDFSFEDVVGAQVDQMDANEISKEYGVSIEEAQQAKEDYKINIKNQIDAFRNADKVAKATLNLMGSVGTSVSPMRLFLTNQLYNAQGLDRTMNDISAKISDMWNKDAGFFASRLRLVGNLKLTNAQELKRYTDASNELTELESEIDKLNKELPSIANETTLDEEGNTRIVDKKIQHLDRIQELVAKTDELRKTQQDRLERINKLESINSKTKFGGLFENTNYQTLSHEDIIEGQKALEDLDIYKQELLNNKTTKQQGIYLNNLLEAYGKGLASMQNLSTMYDELASKDNKNLASVILRLKGGNTVEDFKETEQEKKRLDALIDTIKDKTLRDVVISDRTEVRSVIRALLRAGTNLTNKRFDRNKELIKVYDYKTNSYIVSEAYLEDVNEPVLRKAWSAYVQDGLNVDDDGNFINVELGNNVDDITRKRARKIPLSNREQIIFNENENFFRSRVRAFRKNPTDGIGTYEEVLESIKERKKNSKISSRENFNYKKNQDPEKEYLEEKIARKLKNLSNLFQSGLTLPRVLEITRDFSEKDISRYIELQNKGVLNKEETIEFDNLQEKLRIISEFQGTSTEDDSNLLDDINQLAQLMSFSEEKNVKQVNSIEVGDVANTENEFSNSFRNSEGRDLSVAQNYSKSFVTKKITNDGESVVEISNISPNAFVANTDGMVVDSENRKVDIANMENSQFVNQNFKIVFLNGVEVPFSINVNGNLVFSETEDAFENLKNNTNYVFEAISSFTKAQPLLFVQDGEVLYVNSDFVNRDEVITVEGRGKNKVETIKTFTNIIDQEAIQDLQTGEELIIVYPQNNTYNKTLKNGVQTNQEALLMLYTKTGKFVGVLKRVGAETDSLKNNKNIYYNLRKQAVEQGKKSTTFVNEKQGLKDTGLTVPIEIIWHGHPNLKMSVDETTGEVTTQNLDFDKNTSSKVINIGYVENGNIVTKKDNSLSLDQQYYMKAVLKKNQGKKVPFIVMKINGRDVMYPVSLKVLESNPVATFDSILDNFNLSNGEKVLQLNDLLNRYNIPHTSFFFNNSLLNNERFVTDVRNNLSGSDLYANVIEWTDNRSIAETLENEAQINIDLNDSPFHSPKIKFGIPVVSGENTEEKATKIILTEQEFLKRKKSIEDLMATLPDGITTKDGKVFTSPQYDSLKAQLDDLVDRYNKTLKNEENKKRGSEKVLEDSEKEINKKC